MRIGFRNAPVTALLAVAIAFIAKDLTMPLVGFAVLGAFDRFVGGLTRVEER